MSSYLSVFLSVCHSSYALFFLSVVLSVGPSIHYFIFLSLYLSSILSFYFCLSFICLSSQLSIVHVVFIVYKYNCHFLPSFSRVRILLLQYECETAAQVVWVTDPYRQVHRDSLNISEEDQISVSLTQASAQSLIQTYTQYSKHIS